MLLNLIIATVQFLILLKNKHLQLSIASRVYIVIPDINLGFKNIAACYSRPI